MTGEKQSEQDNEEEDDWDLFTSPLLGDNMEVNIFGGTHFLP